MPIQLSRAKQLATEYYTNQQQMENQQQQQQLPPQNQVQQPAPEQQQAAPVQQVQQHHANHPILRNAIQLPEYAELNMPTVGEITTTYNSIGVVLGDKQREDVIAASMKLFRTQEELAEKTAEMHQRPQARKTVTLAEAVKLSDASLVKHFGEYEGAGVDQYLYLRYSLISNKYYALLPKDASSKLSREEIINRLARLYAEEPANRKAELISFYENLVRLKDIEASTKEAPAEPAPVQNAPAITAEERSGNEKVFAKNVKYLSLGAKDQADYTRRLDLMTKIMKHGNNPADDFLKTSSIQISPEQKEGIRQCLSWMYRNSCKTSHSKLAFVDKLASSAPEKILLALYLVEKGKQDAPASDDFYKATHGYVPNFATFKGRLVASRFKIWKRIGRNSQDDVVNWSALGSAVRFATGEGAAEAPTDIDNFINYSTAITALNTQVANAGDNALLKRESLVHLLEQKGNLILTYYRSAGLNPDMPLDMLPNVNMRAEVTTLLQEISDGVQQIHDLTANLPEDQQAPGLNLNYSDVANDQKAQIKDPDSPLAIFSLLDTAMNPLKVAGMGTTAMGIAKEHIDEVSNLMKTVGYNGAALTVGGVTGIIGLILALKSVVGVAKSGSGLSFADHLAQGLQVSGGLVNSLGSGTVTGAKIVNAIKGVEETASTVKAPWYGSTTVKTAGESFETATGGIQFVAGCVAIAAGTVMTVAGGIQLGRVNSSRNDLRNVNRALVAKHGELSPEQKKLRNFLSHQNRSLNDQEDSACVQTITGALTLIGGMLTTTGILAPIGGAISILSAAGNLVFGLYQSRYKKKKTIKATVDENLKITDSAVRNAKQANPGLAAFKNDEVRDIIRQEAMGVLGFANYKQCFAHYMKEYAVMLYENVMEKTQNNPDRQMYVDALKSLGMHMDIQKKKPGAAAIYAKLMK